MAFAFYDILMVQYWHKRITEDVPPTPTRPSNHCSPFRADQSRAIERMKRTEEDTVVSLDEIIFSLSCCIGDYAFSFEFIDIFSAAATEGGRLSIGDWKTGNTENNIYIVCASAVTGLMWNGITLLGEVVSYASLVPLRISALRHRFGRCVCVFVWESVHDAMNTR